MNERIQEVYELNNQAGVQWTNEDKLKFAELIVQQCLKICKERERPNLYGIREVETAIKEHFGVEHVNARLRSSITKK